MGLNGYKFPWSNFHGFNLDWVINTVKEIQESVENFVSQDFETKTNITINRKLDNNANFTGTWFGKSYNYIVGLISKNEANINVNNDKIVLLTEQFEDGATGVVIDCGNFNDTEINRMYDGGVW